MNHSIVEAIAGQEVFGGTSIVRAGRIEPGVVGLEYDVPSWMLKQALDGEGNIDIRDGRVVLVKTTHRTISCNGFYASAADFAEYEKKETEAV